MYQKKGYIIFRSHFRVIGDKMFRDKMTKLKRKIRKLDYYDRIDLMDWMNRWYEAMKEEQERDEE